MYRVKEAVGRLDKKNKIKVVWKITKKDLKNSHLCLCVPKTNIHTLIYQVIVITLYFAVEKKNIKQHKNTRIRRNYAWAPLAIPPATIFSCKMLLQLHTHHPLLIKPDK